MQVNFSIDSENLRRALARLHGNFGIGVDRAIEVQMGLVLERVQKWTPPRTQAQGRRAVANEVQRVFMTPGEVFAVAQREKGRTFARALYRAMITQNVGIAQRLIREVPSLAGMPVASTPNMALHQAARNSRGKVPRNLRPMQILTSSRELKRAIAGKQKSVGKAKKGWEAGLDGTRAHRRSSAWVKRVHGTRGSYRRPNTQRGLPAVATNDAPSIGSLERRLVRTSLDAQARALHNQIAGALRDSARREGLVRQYGRP